MKKIILFNICFLIALLCSSCGGINEEQISNVYTSNQPSTQTFKTNDMDTQSSCYDSKPSYSNSNKENHSLTTIEKDNTDSIHTPTLSSDLLNTENKVTISSSTDEISGGTIPEVDTCDISYEEKQKKEYETLLERASVSSGEETSIRITSDDIITNYLDYNSNPYISAIETLKSMNNRYEIDFIRKIDSSRMYTIHKPESGGLFYSFYNNGALECTAYITKALSYNDYENIVIGSSLNDIEMLEPATYSYEKRITEWSKDNTIDNFEQHIILKDGLLKLSYVKQENTFIVSNIDFYNNFKENITYEGFDSPLFYDYKILDEDFPN